MLESAWEFPEWRVQSMIISDKSYHKAGGILILDIQSFMIPMTS